MKLFESQKKGNKSRKGRNRICEKKMTKVGEEMHNAAEINGC